MRILETGPNFKVWVNEDNTELEIVRHPDVSRGVMRETMNIMANGAWIAHGLDEREDGTLYERWVKYTSTTKG